MGLLEDEQIVNARRCPTCLAKAGDWCITPGGRRLVHKMRRLGAEIHTTYCVAPFKGKARHRTYDDGRRTLCGMYCEDWILEHGAQTTCGRCLNAEGSVERHRREEHHRRV